MTHASGGPAAGLGARGRVPQADPGGAGCRGRIWWGSWELMLGKPYSDVGVNPTALLARRHGI